MGTPRFSNPDRSGDLFRQAGRHALARAPATDREAADRLRSPEGLEAAQARPLWHAAYGGADLDWIVNLPRGTAATEFAQRLRLALVRLPAEPAE